MDSDLELADLAELGYFRGDEARPFIILRLNDVVNRLLGALKEPVELKPNDQVYGAHGITQAALRVSTRAELDLLQAVRSGNKQLHSPLRLARRSHGISPTNSSYKKSASIHGAERTYAFPATHEFYRGGQL